MARGQLLTMSSLTGSIGGLTFRDDGGGNIMYGKINQQFKRSNKSTQRNAWVSYYARQWRIVSRTEQDNWRRTVYAGLSGFQLFMYCHLNRSVVGLIPVITCQQLPASPQISQLQGVNIAGAGKNISISIIPSPSPAWAIEYQAAPVLSSGVQVIKESLFRTIAIVMNSITGTTLITTQYNATFGNAANNVGSISYVRARLIHKNSGYATLWLIQKVIIT